MIFYLQKLFGCVRVCVDCRKSHQPKVRWKKPDGGEGVMDDRCWGGMTSLHHLWQLVAERTVWVDSSTAPATVLAPAVMVYRCAYCGAERTQHVTSTGPRP